MKSIRFNRIPRFCALLVLTLLLAPGALCYQKSGVFIRFKVSQPQSEKIRVTIRGHARKAPWNSKPTRIVMPSNQWSDWLDLTAWNWHGKIDRSGGVAEYPSISILIQDLVHRGKVHGSTFEIELADRPSQAGIVKAFTDSTKQNAIIFNVPYPLRKNILDFETGRQAAARHASWARSAINGKAPVVKSFSIATNLVLRQFPDIADLETATLKSLGFNTIGGINSDLITKYGVRTFASSWMVYPDPAVTESAWEIRKNRGFYKELKTDAGRIRYDNFAYFAISDEIKVLDFRRADPDRLDSWFRTHLGTLGDKENYAGKRIATVKYPLAELSATRLDRSGSLNDRKILYQAARFGQLWSIQQLGQTARLLKGLFPKIEMSTLLPSHGFFGNAWGKQFIGMSYRMMDIFEIGRTRPVDQIAVEDWFGLNHMYGPSYTWSGAQSFGYYNALIRSATHGSNIKLRGFLTPSDDDYLRLKAYSSLGQGAKSLYFWSFGPTMAATENYWSDLRSEYDGIVKINRAIEKTEDVLLAAKPVTDKAAIFYSVSNDIWSTDRQAAFVEKRLLWHALRHSHVQPDFIDEVGAASGGLSKYKALFIADAAISRSASRKIEEWVRLGGVLYLSSGAATRDEYYESYLPPFAAAVWKNGEVRHQIGTFNERTTLRSVVPMGTASVELYGKQFKLPVLGARSVVEEGPESFSRFENGTTAGRIVSYGKGKIVAVGYMPMLAYGRAASFQPTALGEKWQPEARTITDRVIELAGVKKAVGANVPVVEASLLRSPDAFALVLVNFTYRKQEKLRVTVRTGRRVRSAFSSEGEAVNILSQKSGIVVIELPLKWTDIVILR